MEAFHGRSEIAPQTIERSPRHRSFPFHSRRPSGSGLSCSVSFPRIPRDQTPPPRRAKGARARLATEESAGVNGIARPRRSLPCRRPLASGTITAHRRVNRQPAGSQSAQPGISDGVNRHVDCGTGCFGQDLSRQIRAFRPAILLSAKNTIAVMLNRTRAAGSSREVVRRR